MKKTQRKSSLQFLHQSLQFYQFLDALPVAVVT